MPGRVALRPCVAGRNALGGSLRRGDHTDTIRRVVDAQTSGPALSPRRRAPAVRAGRRAVRSPSAWSIPTPIRSGWRTSGSRPCCGILHDDPRVTVERAFLPDGPRAGVAADAALVRERPAARRLRRPRVLDLVRDRLPARARLSSRSPGIAAAARGARAGGAARAGGRPGDLPQSRAARRVRRSLPDRRGGGDASASSSRRAAAGATRARRRCSSAAEDVAARIDPIATRPRYGDDGDARRVRLRRAGARAWSATLRRRPRRFATRRRRC